MVLVLECGAERRLAIYHTKLIHSEWQPAEDCMLSLKGLNLDDVWDNIVMQIAADEEREKIQKEIARLEALARKEKQPRKKFELVQQIQELKKI